MYEERSASERGRLRVALCRAVLSVVVLCAALPLRWGKGGGGFALGLPDAILIAYVTYSVTVVTFLYMRPSRLSAFVWMLAPWIDVAFATAVAAVVSWERAPVFVLYLFAVLVAAFNGARATAYFVSGVSILLYVGLALTQNDGTLAILAARAACLGILGYAVVYVVQLRRDLEGVARRQDLTAERTRIARTLHDSCVQTLAAVDLQLESCGAILRRGEHEKVESRLRKLQTDIRHEHDTLRSYVRILGNATQASAPPCRGTNPVVSVRADFDGPAEVVEQVLHILREGVTNVCQHAQAKAVTVAVRERDGDVVVTLDDDGGGLPAGGAPPWSIASRVKDLGGRLEVREDGPRGAHLVVVLPRGRRCA